MLIIRGTQDIFMSKRDNCAIGVDIVDTPIEGEEAFELADREYLILKVWEKGFRKKITELQTEPGTSVFNITPEVTANLCGNFVYSVDLMFADGTKETIIGQSPSTAPKFVVMEA